MDKKIIESFEINDFEILTDDGFKDVCALHKTVKYDVYKLKTTDFELCCADNHIVFLSSGEEIYVKNLQIGNFIKTINGDLEVLDIFKTDINEHMWDFELTDNNVKYYTNGILSHNTEYIRYLLTILKKDVIYLPPHMTASLSDPSFITFLMNYENSVLVLEDAENAIRSREESGSMSSVSNLLNISDGILSDCLKMQLIVTFNTEKTSIDQALLRPGRLIAEHKFEALSLEDTKNLVEHLNLEIEVTEGMTLTSIYNHTEKDSRKKPSKKIGFNR